ncbi:MAG: Crp/Fnr family transcriptional regulator [Pseudomonadota bacterium]
MASKLSNFADLSPADRRLLAALEKDERTYEKDQVVRRAGDPIHELFVLKSGWLTSFSVLEDGRRQLLRLFYPGDIVDLSEVALETAHHDIKCVTEAVLCPFPKAGLEPIFVRSPRLTALLFAMTVKESSILLDRIRAIGRLSAYERLCYLMLEIADRLSLTVGHVKDGFRLPLTQSDLADLLGLTNVYVSKTLSRIERDRLVRRQGNRVTILDHARMAQVCEYRQSNRIDTSWFPGT